MSLEKCVTVVGPVILVMCRFLAWHRHYTHTQCSKTITDSTSSIPPVLCLERKHLNQVVIMECVIGISAVNIWDADTYPSKT